MEHVIFTLVLYLPILIAAPAKEGTDGNVCHASQMINEFSFDMQQLVSGERGKNMIFSSYSIFEALAMLNVGAKSNTKKQIEAALKLKKNGGDLLSMLKAVRSTILKSGSGSKLDIANKVWIADDMNILKPFNGKLKDFFDVVMGKQPFATKPEDSRRRINKWVADNTGEMIQKLFPKESFDSDTKLVLANAIYFKGQWAKPFNPEYTKPSTFFMSEHESIDDVPFMFKDDKIHESIDNNIQLIELPYEGKSFTMVIAMPLDRHPEPGTDHAKVGIRNINELNDVIDAKLFKKWLTKLSSVNVEKRDLYLPKFEVKGDIKLRDHLEKLGVRDVFDANTADLSAITGQKNLFCSSAVHKAYLKVDEKGTKASAATGFKVQVMSMPLQIRVDRPFLFFIVHKPCNSIIFSGKVVNPLIA